MRKRKLTVQEQIEYMKIQSGINFNLINEEAVKDFLSYNNYYFKIKSYAKNYEKYTEGKDIGKYINLEFAYLVEISKIDMYFRRIIMKMTLDIEHYLKTQLLRDFQINDQEDGYDIIDAFFGKYPYIKEGINRKDKNSACSDLILRYKDNFAIWNIVEVLSFSDLTKLYQLYYQKYKTKGSMEQYLWSVKFLRNAAAHNSCLLNSLRMPYTNEIRPNKRVINYLSKIDGISREARKHRMRNPVIHDFVVTLYVFNNIASSKKVKQETMKEIKCLMDDRLTVNKEFFQKNQLLISYYHFLKTIIDYYYNISVQ